MTDTAVVERILAGLADPTRRQILDLLADAGSGTATTVAAALPVSRQAVVKHLAILDRAGLVTGRRSGREVRYQPCPGRLDAAARWMIELAGEWNRRLGAIKRIAEGLVTDAAAEGHTEDSAVDVNQVGAAGHQS
ncbi:MAG TPA: metalloregulator ArsR/SmtB family transcription factor [Pseudonocardiaceae bacterium]|nr:metalloregulator ArsR/SmtB family transcription factor [Pseudonocardiaceae bacterium]